MKYFLLTLCSVFIFTGCVASSDPSDQETHVQQVIRVQQEVPDFEVKALMPDDTIQTVRLNDYKDKWKLIFFYPKDFTFVCPTELRELAQFKEKFEEINTVVMAVSVDSAESHKKWRPDLTAETGETFDFVWLSDESTELSRMFGVYDENSEVAVRGAFIISPHDNVLQGSITTNENVGRSSEELIRIIQANQTGSLCPAGWKPGDEVLEPTAEELARVDAL